MTGEEGGENPMDKYIRFKNNINLWYAEMDEAGLTKEEQQVLKPYFLKSHGVPPSQEQMMMMLMDADICNFSLADANSARKIVGKKLMSKIPELQDKVLKQAKSEKLGQYVWKNGIGPQMGYSFSIVHALAYSFIGFQTVFAATHWNPIYWNTACLIVNSGALEDNSEETIVDIYAPEGADLAEGVTFQDLPDKSAKVRKTTSTDYAKLAKAIGDIISAGIKVSLVDINKSSYGFKPNVENNEIMFGMKALSNINDATIETIINNRPYTSFKDFLNKVSLNKSAMISLIKAGAFDALERDWAKELNIEPRILVMTYYLSIASEPKKKLTLQNFNGLLQKGLVPDELDLQRRVFNFNKYLKAYQKVGQYYVFNDICNEFYSKYFDLDTLNIINGVTCILQSDWDKIYKKQMDCARAWLKENHNEVLKEFNWLLFQETWNKYASGSISAWEMDSLCFYYHDHELKNANLRKYGIDNFFNMPEEPIVDYFFKRNGKEIPIYKTYKIIGTVISKNDTRSSVSILTTSGVVNVKFTKDYFAMYNRQISEPQEDGTKKIVEKGWFTKGTKIMVTGFRRDDQFVAKRYANTPTHQLYKITDIDDEGNMNLVHERYKQGE